MPRRDLTTGSILGNIIHLAWPTAIAMSLHTGFNIVDAIFVGKISPDAIAAVTMMFPVMFLLFAVANGIGIGATSLIARSLGRRDQALAEDAARHALVLAAGIGVSCTVLGVLCQVPVFRFMGSEAEVLPLAVRYGTWVFLGVPFMFIASSASAVLRGEGDMRTPMVIMGLAVGLNVLLDWLLIFGVGPFPRLGIAGAAIATAAARFFSAALLLAYVLVGRGEVKVRLSSPSLDPRVVRGILDVGMPACASHVTMSVSGMLLIRIISTFGKEAVAAYGLLMRLNQIAILPCVGIGTAVITLVGHNVGAGKLKRAQATTWVSVLCAMAVTQMVCFVLISAPRLWMRIFSADEQVIAYGVSYLRFVPFSFVFMAVGIVIGKAFQGAGRAMPALAITFLRVIVLAVPGAYVLSQMSGLRGVWIAIAGSSICAAVISATWFKTGAWKRAPALEAAAGERKLA